MACVCSNEAGHKNPRGAGVIWGVKEKRVRDGKRSSASGRLERLEVKTRAEREAEALKRDSLHGMVPGSRKEDRFLITVGSRGYWIFDPEECLKVGRHDGKLGIVCRIKSPQEEQRARPYDNIAFRRLVEWDPETGQQGLARESMRLAAKRGKMTGDPPKWLLRDAEEGRWGSREFWKKLVADYQEGARLDAVREVMDA